MAAAAPASSGTQRDELWRLSTFSEWPLYSTLRPTSLARCGFIYDGFAERVRCPLCHLVVERWTPRDDPCRIHRSRSPQCSFVLQSAATAEQPDSTPTSGNPNQVASPNPNCAGDARPQIKNPQYADISARIQSFRDGCVSHGQSAEALATAGFFYVGPEDNVRCFTCNGGLKNFQPDDDPWTEHARYFPRCKFILENRDQSFIDACRIDRSTVPDNGNVRTSHQQHREADVTGSASVVEENQQLRDARSCKVCMDRDVDTVFLPCGHLVCCSNCSPSVRHCVICRGLIRGTVRIFLS